MNGEKSSLKRPIEEMPGFVAEALEREGLLERYRARPPYQQNDYLRWIKQAKREETRQKRLGQMLDELRRGDTYMGMKYRAKKQSYNKAGANAE
ncbi:MAG TPA: YdeI/OmpD-associated family protein [Bacillota bacterium]|nr:YdeI/OmpD-associated family protein [Clostridiales bacterium]HPT84437.1 YdeI/OmpD-associated family protein [Bacillota bacterium]